MIVYNLFAVFMAILGMLLGILITAKIVNKKHKYDYDNGWCDAEQYYKENYELIPIDKMLDTLSANTQNPVQFLREFEEFLDECENDDISH